jgi:hypothetical protein
MPWQNPATVSSSCASGAIWLTMPQVKARSALMVAVE